MSPGSVYLDAILEPPRSLSREGMARVMLTAATICCLFSIGFLLVGAYPVAGFMGLEILLLWFFIDRGVRRRAARTHVRVTADMIEVCRVDARGREARASLPSHFARVVVDGQARGAHALRVVSGQRWLTIGDHLTGEERNSLARRIETALQTARLERQQVWEDA